MHDDFATEPIRGLPERPPKGERILWQGAPEWKPLARRVFHVRKIAIYFGLLAVWRLSANLYDGESIMTALAAAMWMVALGAVAVGFFALLGWLTARTTVYTITNKRLVMRIGIALPISINLPFRMVKSASLKRHPNGTGDISVSLLDDQRVAYLVLLPHARPWRLAKPEPLLRCVPQAETVARTLADALAATIAKRSKASSGETASEPSQPASPGTAPEERKASLRHADAAA